MFRNRLSTPATPPAALDFTAGNPVPWGAPPANGTADAETPAAAFFLLGARHRRNRQVVGVNYARNPEANQVAESLEQAAQQSFPRTAACLPEIFDFMDRFFAHAGVGDEHRMPMQFVVEEWFTNLVKYSRGGTRDILLDLKRQDGRLVLSLTDFGVERFDIREVRDVDVNLDLKHRTPGGLGIHLLKRMVDDIGYEYVDGRSTTTFVKKLE